MRILFANDGIGDAGGVQTYLTRVSAILRERGHEIALLHLDPLRDPHDSPMPGAPHFCVQRDGPHALAASRAWRPDVVFSHNMRDLDVEEALLGVAPVVKMMHGYAGTCISGQKMHAFPHAIPCGRTFGLPCLGLYVPRRCGVLGIGAVAGGYGRAARQQRFFPRYERMIVASGHMRDEYARHGMPNARIAVAPLFGNGRSHVTAAGESILFLGRMTHLKGGDLLIRAIAEEQHRAGTPRVLVMAGDGPQREEWQSLALRLGVAASFPGWVSGDEYASVLASAAVVAIPSVWPEPFALSGLEAAEAGVPAVAFDVGGIREWLRDGENGCLVPYDADAVARFAAALHGVLSQPRERARLGSGARAVAAALTVERHVSILEGAFEALDGVRAP